MIKYDIIIIGAGLIGIPIAYELAKAGRKVAVVDAKGLGAGASTANGGMLLLEGNANGPAFSMTTSARLKRSGLSWRNVPRTARATGVIS